MNIIKILDKIFKLEDYYTYKLKIKMYNEYTSEISDKYDKLHKSFIELTTKYSKVENEKENIAIKFNKLQNSYEELENDINDWVIKYNDIEKKSVEMEYENVKLKKEIINLIKEYHIADSSFLNQ